MPRETVEQKALRLVAEGRVRMTRLDAGGCSAVVAGDTLDVYGEREKYTTELRGRWQCTCAHGANSRSLCSHCVSVQMIYRAVRPAIGGKK